jgi:predicted alpha/beta superfamily hydrolase
MKKYLLIIPFSLILIISSCFQNEVSIKIEVEAKNLPDGSVIYITGNDEQLGNWQPDVVSLDEVNKGKWVKNLSFPVGKKLEFKFTRGSWDKEALSDNGLTPPNYAFEVRGDTTISVSIDLWADQVERKIEGQITGTVEYYRNFSGKNIKPRDIIVWLPPDYFSDIKKHYPVLYMHDGQNIIDPSTATFEVDWQIDEAADSLIKQKLIEPIIIVGINNTIDRNSEYAENDTGYAYMNFIIDSLKPFIDRNYRTKPDRNNTANGGGSLGGLIPIILVWEYYHVFSKAICFSPAFKIDQYNFVDNVMSYSGNKKDIKLFIHNGDNELDSQLQVGVDEMLKALKKQGFKEKSDYFYIKSIKSQHGERDWSKNIPLALIFLFGTEMGRSLL